jgi:hypothetical protein
MDRFPLRLTVLFAWLLAIAVSHAYSEETISTVLMKSTFKIEGGKTYGTVFIMGQTPPDSVVKEQKTCACVMFTAAHVLEKIRDDYATLITHFEGTDGFKKYRQKIRIRQNTRPLWYEHPELDIAAMRISLDLPEGCNYPVAGTNVLATDEMLAESRVLPGDEVLVLGYPLGFESNDFGFPVLRSGRIASYPLTPTSQIKTFQLDFEVFPGNSGSPVFMYSDGGSGKANMVLGLVSGAREMMERAEFLDESIVRKHNVGLAIVVHASFIRELLDMMPPPSFN